MEPEPKHSEASQGTHVTNRPIIAPFGGIGGKVFGKTRVRGCDSAYSLIR